MKLYVGNLSFDTSEADLQDIFEQFGTVREIHVINDRETGRSRGFAFVTMGNDAERSGPRLRLSMVNSSQGGPLP